MSSDLVYTPIFKSIYEFAKALPMEDAYTLLMACCAYANGEDMPELTGIVAVIFENDARPSIDRTLAKAKRSRQNGKRHAKANPGETESTPTQDPTETQAEPRANPEVTQTEPSGNPDRTQTEPSGNLKQTMINDQGSMINDQETLKYRESDGFAPPSIDEVRAYGDQFCRKKGIPPGSFSAERFVGYYERRQWKRNGQPLKSWRQAAANWIRKDHPELNERGHDGKPDRFAVYD